ncbi:MAG TPA: glycosyltransferase family 4 protein [Candidatus Paceibacterota bacterium]|nr:glycosyltransferase family 4 protein [Candidatus Paceibacterota bacterium]
MKKLVLATPLYPPDIGGPATYAVILEKGLPARGIEVELVKFGDVRHLPKGIRHIAYFSRVRRAMKGADAVLALDPVSVGLPACLAAWLARKPFFAKIVGDYAWEQGSQRYGIEATLDEFVTQQDVPSGVRFLRRVQTGVARRAARIIVPSEYLKGIVASWGIPKEKIEVIYNAVPVETLGAVPEAVARLPRPLVVTAGRLVPWKHMGGVIDAAQATGASLAIVGDGPLRGALARRAFEKLPEHHVITGTLPHDEALAVTHSAYAFVLNSSYEGLSHALIEALAVGTPVVATRAGGNPEVITDGENGLLVPVGDTAALTAALRRVLTDTELRTRLGSHASESVKRFSEETMLEKTIALLART